MENQLILKAYAVYLPIVLLLTFFVARSLFKSGKVFMLDIFNQREDIAEATNRLFKVGFYLLNVGFALLILKIYASTVDYQDIIEILSYKIGGFSIYLGIMLFLNMFLFFRGKRKSKKPEGEVELHLEAKVKDEEFIPVAEA
ncbi:MAG: amino acid permease [Saprospiraceae bacterium]|jgi:amino acid permease